MATIDSRIALGVQPTVQLESPANSLAKMLQLQGLQQQNEAARYDMDLKRQDAEQTNRLRTFLASGIDLDTQEGRNALYRAAPTKADAIIKSRVDTRKAITDAEKSAFEVSQNRYKAYKQTLGALYNAPNLSKDMVMSAGQEMVALGVITPELYQRAVAGLPDDVAALRQQLQQGLAAQLTPEQVFTVFSAKPTAVDDGQNISYRDLNPNSPTFGQNVGGPSVKKQQSPDSVASNETTRRGQNMVDSRMREKNANDKAAVSKVEWKQDVDGNWVALPKEVSGNDPVVPITTTVPGKRTSQANNSLGIIAEAEKIIDKATGSYLGTAIDEGARAFGASTPGADAAAQLKALEGALMMAQPRMEGPQSDKDVALYKQMAGRIGDSTVPPSQKKVALDVIKTLHNRYAKGVIPSQSPAPSPAPAGAPQPGTVKGGYRFKGGNPADQNNWEKL